MLACERKGEKGRQSAPGVLTELQKGIQGVQGGSRTMEEGPSIKVIKNGLQRGTRENTEAHLKSTHSNGHHWEGVRGPTVAEKRRKKSTNIDSVGESWHTIGVREQEEGAEKTVIRSFVEKTAGKNEMRRRSL